MKKLILNTRLNHIAYLLLVVVIFCGCGSNDSKQQRKQLNKVQEVEYGTSQVLEIDSCEYIVWNYGYAGGMVHKQNCKFCTERSKK